MSISTACTHCGRNIRAKEKYAGKRVKCPACRKPVKLAESNHDSSVSAAEEPPDFESLAAMERAAPVQKQAVRVACPGCGLPFQARVGTMSAKVECKLCGTRFAAYKHRKQQEKEPRRKSVFEQASLVAQAPLRSSGPSTEPADQGGLLVGCGTFPIAAVSGIVIAAVITTAVGVGPSAVLATLIGAFIWQWLKAQSQ